MSKTTIIIFGMIGVVCGFLVMILNVNNSRQAFFGLGMAFVSAIGTIIRTVFSKEY